MFEWIFILVLVLACTFKVIFLSSVRSSRKTNSIDYTMSLCKTVIIYVTCQFIFLWEQINTDRALQFLNIDKPHRSEPPLVFPNLSGALLFDRPCQYNVRF